MEVRRRRHALLAALLFTTTAALAGCSVGEYGTETTTTPDAATTTNNNNNNAGEASFDSMIKPLVGNCTGCHGGGTPPNLTSFTALQAKYKMKPGSTNILVTKGDHSGIQYLNATAKTTVQNWIDSL